MKVMNLRCAHDHRFEGWFASDDDYSAQQARGLVACPLCTDTTIERLPSAPRLNVAKLREQPATQPVAMQEAWLRAVRHVMANTEDVGERFAEEARRIHYGETEGRGIRGQATPQDAQSLREEGIEVVAMPMPAALEKPLQ